MRNQELNWSKTRVQCPYCDGWYTNQGIQGHIRFRHPDKKKNEEKEEIKIRWTVVFGQALQVYQRDSCLTPALREHLLDVFLLDYLEKLATGKT